MSLLRLLAAGRTLIGANNSGSRYRETRQRLLPKFASGRGDGTAARWDYKTTPQGDKASDAVRQPIEVSPGEMVPRPAPHSQSAVPMKSSAAEDKLDAQERRRPAGCRVSASGLIRRGMAAVGGLGALIVRPRNKLTGKPASRASRNVVQGELSLDQVKVVRNDLSQDELEVVPVKSTVAAAIAPVLGSGANRSHVDGAQNRAQDAGQDKSECAGRGKSAAPKSRPHPPSSVRHGGTGPSPVPEARAEHASSLGESGPGEFRTLRGPEAGEQSSARTEWGRATNRLCAADKL
jgi:hypothetical protein